MSRVVSVFAVSLVVSAFKSPMIVVIQVVRDTSGQAVSRFQGCAGSVFPCLGSCNSDLFWLYVSSGSFFLVIEYLYYDF